MVFSIVFPKELIYSAPSLFLKNVQFFIIVLSGPKIITPKPFSEEIQFIIVSILNTPAPLLFFINEFSI